MEDKADVSRILSQGSLASGSAEELLPLVYQELRALAGSFFTMQAANHTLQPTALVHEAYLRMAGPGQPGWSGRAHFFAVAAKAMRQVLVNHAEARRAEKRGGGRERVSLSESVEVGASLASSPAALDVDADALHEALEHLAHLDERQARIVEMRYFGGMTVAEVAHVLAVSASTVEKDWRMAKLWLLRELGA